MIDDASHERPEVVMLLLVKVKVSMLFSILFKNKLISYESM